MARVPSRAWHGLAGGLCQRNPVDCADDEPVSNATPHPRIRMALDHPRRYGWGMNPHWREWMLMAGGVLVVVSFAALFLALSGRPDQWITLALASALIVIVV